MSLGKIDMFCHIFPRDLVSSMKTDWLPKSLRFLQTGSPRSKCFVDEDERVRLMDSYGIDIEVLTVSLASFWTRVPSSEAAALTRLSNDSLAAAASKHPDRLIPIAALPDLGMEGAMDELDRAITTLGMRGCMIFSNVGGKPLDAPEFRPFFEKMLKYDLPILIHPVSREYYDWIGEYRLDHMLGWPFDTSLAMGRLVFGGVMKRCPGLKIVCHHVGGMIPHFIERMRGMNQARVDSKLQERAGQVAEEREDEMRYFEEFYGDTVTNGGLSELRCGYDFFGPRRIVFATDYPFGPDDGGHWTRGTIQNVEKLGISPEEQQLIFEANARRLLKL